MVFYRSTRTYRMEEITDDPMRPGYIRVIGIQDGLVAAVLSPSDFETQFEEIPDE